MELEKKTGPWAPLQPQAISHSNHCCFLLRSWNTFMSNSLGLQHPYGASRPGYHHFPLNGEKVSYQPQMGQLVLGQTANPSLSSGLTYPRELGEHPPGALIPSQMASLSSWPCWVVKGGL